MPTVFWTERQLKRRLAFVSDEMGVTDAESCVSDQPVGPCMLDCIGGGLFFLGPSAQFQVSFRDVR